MFLRQSSIWITSYTKTKLTIKRCKKVNKKCWIERYNFVILGDKLIDVNQLFSPNQPKSKL
ncbi:hypothetical protein DB891_00340 [Flavobacterium laiguense]|uniref:Uncharacterized protein n=1 Tax=Flavobacterium laiguense TaxID=2169409 RepID=A0A2U1K225_9FLAO|nr:hypothetical protein DB891_00340 [Flavobacterium laiguense]